MSLAFLPVRISDADFIGEGWGTWFPTPPFRVLAKIFADGDGSVGIVADIVADNVCPPLPSRNSNHPKTPKM